MCSMRQSSVETVQLSQLYHWVKCLKDNAGNIKPADTGEYQFAKYNKKACTLLLRSTMLLYPDVLAMKAHQTAQCWMPHNIASSTSQTPASSLTYFTGLVTCMPVPASHSLSTDMKLAGFRGSC